MVITLVVLGPVYIFARQRGPIMTAAYLAGLINAICLQQYSSRVVGRLESGEYEAYLLAPLPTLSLYLANLMSFLLLMPVFGTLYGFAILLLRLGELQLLSFIIALLACVLLNASWSILIAGVHLAYRSIHQLASLLSILVILFSMLVIPAYNSSLQWLLQFIPWTHSTLLVVQAVHPFVERWQITASLAYILVFSAVSLPVAVRFYRMAENKTKREGFSIERIYL